MKMLVYTLDLKEESVIEKYVERHAKIEPAVPKKLRELGVLQNRICRLGRRLVNIMIVRDDYTVDVLKDYVKDPACKAWDEEMAQYQVSAPDAKEGELWALMDVVFLHDMLDLR